MAAKKPITTVISAAAPDGVMTQWRPPSSAAMRSSSRRAVGVPVTP